MYSSSSVGDAWIVDDFRRFGWFALIAVKLALLALHVRLGRGRPHALSRRDAAAGAEPGTHA